MKIKHLIGIFGMLALAACDADIEPVKQSLVPPKDQNPAQWAVYMKVLGEYKQSEHYMIYAHFDNASEKVVSEKNCLRSLPDSLDIVALKNPLSQFDREDLTGLHEKSTRVLLTVDCSDPATAVAKVDEALASIAADGLDGIVISYTGTIGDDAKAVEAAIAGKLGALTGKTIVFEGNPSFIAESNRTHYDLFVFDVTEVSTLFAMLDDIDYLVNRFGIEPSKLLLATSFSSAILDESLKEQAAIPVVARCVMTCGPLAGLALSGVNDDYYSPTVNYPQTKAAINLLNPAYTE